MRSVTLSQGRHEPVRGMTKNGPSIRRHRVIVLERVLLSPWSLVRQERGIPHLTPEKAASPRVEREVHTSIPGTALLPLDDECSSSGMLMGPHPGAFSALQERENAARGAVSSVAAAVVCVVEDRWQ